MSVLFYVAAVIYVLWPDLPPEQLSWACGGMLILYGIIKLVGFFSRDLYALAFQFDFALGLLLILAGIGIFLFPPRTELILPLGLGWLVLVDSLFKVQMSRDARDFGLKRWYQILILAVLTGCASILLIVSAIHGLSFLRLSAACVLLLEGLMNHCVVLFTVRVMHDKKTPAP